MPDGNVPLPVTPLSSPIDPPSTGPVSPSPKTVRKQAEDTFTDGKKFLLFEAAITGIEADARQKGGLTKFDVAIIRSLQREMLAIGQAFVKRNKAKDEKKEKDWQRISKGIEESLAVKPDFDESATEYKKAGNSYKTSLLYSAKKDLQKGAERAANLAEQSGDAREQTQQEKILLSRGQAFLRRPAYTEPLPETTLEEPTEATEKQITNAVQASKILETEEPASPEAAPPAEATSANPDPSPAQDETIPLSEEDMVDDDSSPEPDTGAARVIASLGAPIATSVVGAIATQKAASSDSEETIEALKEEPESAEKTLAIEQILKDLDDQEEALQDKANAARRDIALRAATAKEQLVIEKKRLELLKTQKTLPGIYADLYDEKTLESNLQRALAEVDDADIALLRQQAQTTLPEDQRAALESLIQKLDRLKITAAESPTGPSSTSQKQIDDLRQQIKTFAIQPPTASVTIADTRAELRQTLEQKKYQTEVLTAYEARMRETSVTYLQTQRPQAFAQYQILQTQSPTITIDATSFLSGAELQNLQLEVVAQLKTDYPDVSLELISTLLLAQASTVLAQAQALNAQASMGAVTAFLAGAQATAAAGALATRLAPMAISLLNEARATRDALANEERGIVDRSQRLQTMTAPGAPTSDPQHAATVQSLRNDQQKAYTRRGQQQASLHGQVAALQTMQAFCGAKNTDSTNASADVFSGLLEQSGHTPASVAMPAKTSSPARPTSPPPLPTRSSPARAEEDEDAHAEAVAAHEAAIASQLSSRQVRDRRLNDASQSTTSAGGTSSRSVDTQDSEPLLTIQKKPTNAKEQFALDQRNMIAQTKSLVGGAAGASGFEAAFADKGSSPQEANDVRWLGADEVDTLDDADEDDSESAEEADREAELLEQQQRATHAQSQQNGQNTANNLNRLAKSPGGKKALANGAKLLANPVTAIILVVVALIWLNLRLLIPKEGSLLRQPMGALGKVGTIILDFLAVIMIMNFLIVTVIIVLIPFLPFLLPLGGAFAILQGAIHIFGG